MKLTDILKQIREESSYPKHGDFTQQSLYETYSILSELLDADDAYQYQSVGKGIWSYADQSGEEYYVRLAYVPNLSSDEDGYLELKTYWMKDGKPQYSDIKPDSSTIDLHKRSNTVAKIFRDEVIPFFRSQQLTKAIKIFPIDKVRYRLSKIMVKKYCPSDFEIKYLDNRIEITKS